MNVPKKDRSSIKNSRIILVLSDTEKKTIEKAAKTKGLSMSAVIRLAMSEFLKNNDRS